MTMKLTAFTKYCKVFFVISLASINGQVFYSFQNGTCAEDLPSFCTCNPLQIVCDCQGASLVFGNEFTRQPRSIFMRNCHRLSIKQKSFLSNGPFEVVLQNISNIRLMPESFALDVFREPRINLTLQSSTLHNLPTNGFVGSDAESRVLTGPKIRQQPQLIFNADKCVINKIDPGAFGNFTLQDFSISNSDVKMVSKNAISNHFVGKFKITNSTLGLEDNAIILKETLSDQGLLIRNNSFKNAAASFLLGSIKKDVYIVNNTFPFLAESPFNLRVEGQVFLSNNTFANIPENGLRFQVKDRISIVDNDIYHLQGNAFQLIVPTDGKTFIFLDGNIIRQHDKRSLCLSEMFNEDFVVIKHNIFHQQCSCNISTDISNGLGFEELTPEELYQDKIHQQWLQQGECLKELGGMERHRIDYFLVQFCFSNNRLTNVMLILFAVLLIVISTCVIVAWRRIRQRNLASHSHGSDYQSFSAPAPSSTGQGAWAIVQPDPKRYQETEIHIVFDNAQEMRDFARCSQYSDENVPTKRIKSKDNKHDSYSYDKGSAGGEENKYFEKESVDGGKECQESSRREKGSETTDRLQEKPDQYLRQSCPALTLPD
ncbi:uncharacterized protein LOC122264034 [Penaeus japonicus]|uniref:uncharacterized protein LOC122264034 n=1 Tax=Penaeus japonicus TaxID=27405 RepID=UPI001C70BC60|nr:uncharacterized protein LOC122264034 [Penaeus japonicus]